jgi:hypothetical protein
VGEVPQIRVNPDGRVAQQLSEEFDSGAHFGVRGRVWLITWMTDAFYTKLTDASEVADWTPLVDATALAAQWEKEAQAIATDGFVPLNVRVTDEPKDAAQWREQAKAQAYGMNWCARELRRALEVGR